MPAPFVVSVKTDFDKFARTLTRYQREQLPYAASLALHETVRVAAQDITKALPAIFSGKGAPPTPFTMRAIGTKTYGKDTLRAEIFVKDVQKRYLLIEETGGTVTRGPGAPVLTDVDPAVLNQYRNLPKGLLRRMAADRENYFIGTVKTRRGPVFGLWERVYTKGQAGGRHILRTPRGLKLIVAFRERAVYKPRFGFERQVEVQVGRVFMPALSRGMAKALATAVKG